MDCSLEIAVYAWAGVVVGMAVFIALVLTCAMIWAGWKVVLYVLDRYFDL